MTLEPARSVRCDMPSAEDVGVYLLAHDLFAVSGSVLERLCKLDDVHVWDASDRLNVVVRKNHLGHWTDPA